MNIEKTIRTKLTKSFTELMCSLFYFRSLLLLISVR